ncbi:hypothetical protein [Microvirga yunnanensis]|uniref:hypothetical protein n=1 Tax=Microvirga yunnanensis TaxID=2953740 RepID=UPI0021C8DB7A|nr:hypothetical protein [Microvirga sp. HBU65207]
MNAKRRPDTETHEIAGHTVEIRRIDHREELRIDGVRTKFFVTPDGYNLHDAAYDPPYKSLQEAVTAFLERRNVTGREK